MSSVVERLPKAEMRRHARSRLELPVELSWADPHGAGMAARGKCINISESGLRLNLPVPVPAGAYVNFRVSRMGLGGAGSVRYSRRDGVNFIVGLEFCGGLRFQMSKAA